MTPDAPRPPDAFCPSCGEPRVAGKDFCANCGRNFADAASTPNSPAAPRGALGTSGFTLVDVGLLGGAALLVVAPFLPFLSATAALVGSVSRSGVEITNGEALVLSGVAVLAGFLTVRDVGRPKPLLLPLLGVAGLGLSYYYYTQVNERVADIGSDLAIASIGAGIWVAIAGSLVVLVAGFAGWRQS